MKGFIGVLGIAVAVAVTVASPSMAQTCYALSPPSDPDGHTKWKLSYDTSEISELSLDQILVAGALAANTWNDNANGRTFEFSGTTTRTSLPSSNADCVAAGIDYDLVTVTGCSLDSGSSSGAVAATRGFCKVNGKPTHYQILVFGSNGETCSDKSWGVGNPGSSIDLVAVLTHEFGHAIGLDHSGVPCADDTDCIAPNQCLGKPGRCGGSQRLVSTMVPSGLSSAQRDLYTYDIKCANEVSTLRERWPFVRKITSGVWGAEYEADFNVSPVTDASLGFTSFEGGSPIALAGVRSDCVAWRGNSASNPPCTTAEVALGIGPANIRWMEFSGDDRVVWSQTSQVDNLLSSANESSDPISKHRLRYSRSADGFVSAITGVMSSCSSMSSFMNCSSSVPIFSGEAASSAFLSGNLGAGFENGVTVFAWTNQQRDSFGNQDQMVKVAVGLTSVTTLATPTDLGVRSAVAPGIACNETASPYECIVAYVDPFDAAAQVRIKRFNVYRGALKFELSIEPFYREIDVNTGTAAKIAVLMNNRSGTSNDRFWVVIRALRTNERLEAYSSADGATWEQDLSFSAVSHVGPSSSGNGTVATTGVVYVRPR